ncbi:TIGR02391 family protein [Curtobacterium sp. NPDC098951]|uniref:TIGR02391 family protein n=1 Tax=Curtobacterium sp. NPDC098951 TaxID=3363974 RepID=UPI00381A1A98
MATFSADLLRSGSTEEIARGILSGNDEGAAVNGHNVYVNAEQQFAGERDCRALVGRVSDGWAWLVAHQCVGPSGQSSGGWQRVTRQGARIGQAPSAILELQGEELLAGVTSELQVTAKPAFQRGDFETASFAAMKAVEVRVRHLSGLSNDLIGTKLMQEAFKPGGPLCDRSAEAGEQVATMNLFMGAIGAFKNPASHRTVVFTDPIEAAEVVQLADLLLRMLRRVGDRN